MLLPYFAILILSTPLWTHLFHDRHGVVHPNRYWIVTGIIMIISSLLVTVWILPSKNIVQTFVMSFGIYNTFFPYLITFFMKWGGVPGEYKWYDHLSKTAWPDKWDGWAGLDWPVRMFFLLVIFAACISVYACWNKVLNFYNPC